MEAWYGDCGRRRSAADVGGDSGGARRSFRGNWWCECGGGQEVVGFLSTTGSARPAADPVEQGPVLYIFFFYSMSGGRERWGGCRARLGRRCGDGGDVGGRVVV
ncbi:extensin [Iris pallida]|uniref:Extensin n=1 Tax=Iris pallida TaxID=29817 RepID=A0AAX6E6S4_IRIPA|nr:extensin [Iris pallida]